MSRLLACHGCLANTLSICTVASVSHLPGSHAGFEHSVDTVVSDLLACLDNPGLALMQWNEVFSVAEVNCAC